MLYGLKQASCKWYKQIRAEFEAMGFTWSKADHSIFFKNENGSLLIVAIYVDNLLLLCNNICHIECIKEDLWAIFEITDLGEVCWILNMEVTQDHARRTITLSQCQYVEDILKHHGMANCRPVSTPMAANLKLIKLVRPRSMSTRTRVHLARSCM